MAKHPKCNLTSARAVLCSTSWAITEANLGLHRVHDNPYQWKIFEIDILELQNEALSSNIWIYIFTRSSKDLFKHRHYWDSFVKQSIGKNMKDLYISTKCYHYDNFMTYAAFFPLILQLNTTANNLSLVQRVSFIDNLLPFKSSSYVRFKHHSKLCDRVWGDHLRQRRCLTKFSTVNLQSNKTK